MQSKKKHFFTLLTILGAFLQVAPAYCFAEISVIVHPSNQSALQKEQVVSIFLGQSHEFPGGNAAKPIDQAEEQAARKEFYMKLADKNESEMKTYWSSLIFAGDGSPPLALGGDTEVKAYVRENTKAIGYIDSKSVDSSIKVIYTIK